MSQNIVDLLDKLSYCVKKDDGNMHTDGQAQLTKTTLRPKRRMVKYESRNAKIDQLIKQSLMRIFDEAEVP